MAVKYKMINADFDGTSTMRDGSVSKYTAEAIDRYISNGGVFIINTGRSYLSVCERLSELYIKPNNFPVACLQGGQIWQNGKLLYSHTMEKDEVIKILTDFENNTNSYMQLYAGENLYAKEPHHFALAYEQATGTKQQFVGKLSTYIRENNPAIDKLLVIADRADTLSAYNKYSCDTSFKNTKFVYSTPLFFECIPSQSGKDSALKIFADMYNLELSEVSAIGDGNNDLDMIKIAGYSGAMNNGVRELKELADVVVPDCNEHGLAQFIESLIIED